jgi:gluconolactonase
VQITPEVVGESIRFGEGPTWRTDTSDLIVTSLIDGILLRVDPFTKMVEKFADTSGSPNATAPCSDGGVVVTQNGGVDMRPFGRPDAADPRYVTPGLQIADPSGAVHYLTDDIGPFNNPNDLAIASDGAIWFTDPKIPVPSEPRGRVWRFHEGSVKVMGDRFAFCNGIAALPDGSFAVVESDGLQKMQPDGSRTWLVEHLPAGRADGMSVDASGYLYVCEPSAGLVLILEPDGRLIDLLQTPMPSRPINCCFGGDDLRTLFVTDGYNDCLLAFADLPNPGMELYKFESSGNPGG